jgi:hypothetical protein
MQSAHAHRFEAVEYGKMGTVTVPANTSPALGEDLEREVDLALGVYGRRCRGSSFREAARYLVCFREAGSLIPTVTVLSPL